MSIFFTACLILRHCYISLVESMKTRSAGLQGSFSLYQSHNSTNSVPDQEVTHLKTRQGRFGQSAKKMEHSYSVQCPRHTLGTYMYDAR